MISVILVAVEVRPILPRQDDALVGCQAKRGSGVAAGFPSGCFLASVVYNSRAILFFPLCRFHIF
jgi:hypothetical protein